MNLLNNSNIYFDMASTSNKLWKYNRYRYIMTYQGRPWLPPPLSLLSYLTLALRASYRRCSGDAEREERGSGLSECRIVYVSGWKTNSAVVYTCQFKARVSIWVTFPVLPVELFLGRDDRKKLHEFEEKCVQAYFLEKSEGLHSSQINRIRATAERLDWYSNWFV